MRNLAFYYFAGAILVTLVIVVLLCRSRIARGKRSFFITAIAGNLTANAAFVTTILLSGRIYVHGWRVFTREAWVSTSQHSLESALSDVGLFTVFGTVICMFPVLGVAFYYDRRSKKEQTNVA
jgi:hypothetical protein